MEHTQKHRSQDTQMKKRRLIPFSWTPASWGLTGKSRQLAEAEYNHTGKELELALAQINSQGDLNVQRKLELAVEHKYGDISDYEYDQQMLTLRSQQEHIDETDLKVLKLDIDLQHSKITQDQHARQVADLRGEPYVNVMRMGIDSENVVQGFFELDWNEHFVKMLQDAGITGRDDEEVVNRWFNGVCRTVLLQEQADQDWGFQTEDNQRPDVEYRSDSKD
jgi:hypothetical protein